MEPATGVPDHCGTFAVKNEYDLICLGVNCLIGGFFRDHFRLARISRPRNSQIHTSQ